jgi:periplasmic protein TonB
VVRGLGSGLDAKAVEAVERWRFEPAKKDGKPVNVLISVEVSFLLYWSVGESELAAVAMAG